MPCFIYSKLLTLGSNAFILTLVDLKHSGRPVLSQEFPEISFTRPGAHKKIRAIPESVSLILVVSYGRY